MFVLRHFYQTAHLVVCLVSNPFSEETVSTIVLLSQIRYRVSAGFRQTLVNPLVLIGQNKFVNELEHEIILAIYYCSTMNTAKTNHIAYKIKVHCNLVF